VEIYQIHLEAIGKTPKPSFMPHTASDTSMPTPVETRPVFFGTDRWLDTPVYDRNTVPAGAKFAGPAILNQLDSTTVVPPHTRAEIDEWLNIRIYLEEV
jgi:N-methylhydantoinase A